MSGVLLAETFRADVTQAGIKYSIFEREKAMNYRSNEWTMAIHWALPLLQEILPEEVFAKMSVIACNPTVGIHSGLYPIINGETGELITGVPYTNGLRVPRSRMRELASEGIDVQVLLLILPRVHGISCFIDLLLRSTTKLSPTSASMRAGMALLLPSPMAHWSREP
jgi:hypothetical protein